MYTQVGTCPKCGAPIYVPTIWHAVIPPPPRYSCACFGVDAEKYATSTYAGDNKDPVYINKKIENPDSDDFSSPPPTDIKWNINSPWLPVVSSGGYSPPRNYKCPRCQGEFMHFDIGDKCPFCFLKKGEWKFAGEK